MAIRIPTPLIAGSKSHDLHDGEARAGAEEGGGTVAVAVAVAVAGVASCLAGYGYRFSIGDGRAPRLNIN